MLPPSTVSFEKVPVVQNKGEPGDLSPRPLAGLAVVDPQTGELLQPGITNPSQVNAGSADLGPPTQNEFQALKMRVEALEARVENLKGNLPDVIRSFL